MLHYLDESEHLVRSLSVGHIVVRGKMLTPKLIYLKSALVHVKVNVSLFEIWRASLPDLCFGVQSFYRLPSAVADTLAVLFGKGKEYFQMISMCFFVDLEYNSANLFAVKDYAIDLVVGLVHAFFNSLS